MNVLYEAGEIGSLERARLLQAMWDGWREVLCIRLAALLLVEHQGHLPRPPG